MLYKQMILIKVAHFLEIFYDLSFLNPILSGASVALMTKVCASTMLLLLIEEIRNYENGMTSIGIMFIPSSLKITKLVCFKS
jgi:hypothetical protein